jgi:YD repeat-containing protein
MAPDHRLSLPVLDLRLGRDLPADARHPAELNSVDVGYDNYGNIISKTTTPKPGSSQSAVSGTAYVDTLNCANSGYPVLCYRPVWTRDAAGRQTDYIYNNLGQVTEKTEPADANGVRRKTYVSYDATIGISRPSVVRICGAGSEI